MPGGLFALTRGRPPGLSRGAIAGAEAARGLLREPLVDGTERSLAPSRALSSHCRMPSRAPSCTSLGHASRDSRATVLASHSRASRSRRECRAQPPRAPRAVRATTRLARRLRPPRRRIAAPRSHSSGRARRGSYFVLGATAMRETHVRRAFLAHPRRACRGRAGALRSAAPGRRRGCRSRSRAAAQADGQRH